MKEPALSPVGSGLYQYPSLVQPAAFPKGGPRGKHSLWSDDRADFYHDPRALSVGDIVTARIVDAVASSLMAEGSSEPKDALTGGVVAA